MVKVNSKKGRKEINYPVWVIVGIVIFGIVAWYDIRIGNNVAFYAKWASCGRRPVSVGGSGLMNAGAIHYKESPIFSLARMSPEYYCTPLQAERAGYSADPREYDFPHLREIQKQTKDLEDGDLWQ